ncbi:MAG: glucokinase [Phaeovulum sp.]|uniref:glucokinase n=1 Tax=Phaeovulum sp. TaxID=2934796 RepID=UPI0027318D54|nr:glucokinase [Phaeovulum sp.]MDP2062531.1 glucokinase [Phaeovulum sp.]MDP3861947.1 glucokinase [Phaeovulum sp.]
MRQRDRYALLADIGGTNTRVALAEAGRMLPETIRRYVNAEHTGLDAVLAAYLAAEGGVDCAGACVAAAGPVHDGVASMTNLNWTIDRSEVARATGAEVVAVLNDLQAQGHALGHLAASALRPLVRGRIAPQPGASQLVVGVGTGFNAAPVHEAPGGRLVVASECGHAGLPVRTEADLRLLQFVEAAHGFPGVEDVLSGRGLERLFAWVSSEAGTPRELRAAEIMAALAAGDALAEATGRAFVRLLGTVVGNLSLIHLPYGGVWLIGGVARAFTPYMERFGFSAAFRDKGRFEGFMQDFHVSVIEDDYAALTGCAHYLQGLMHKAA